MIAKTKQKINPVAAKNSVRPNKGMAEGGCGGNSAISLQKIEASPAALLGESRTQQKSFLFLLEEKIRRAQNQKCRENFFAGWRALASGGGAPVRLWGSFIRRGFPENAFGFRSGCGASQYEADGGECELGKCLLKK